jgi:hypothetical protein
METDEPNVAQPVEDEMAQPNGFQQQVLYEAFLRVIREDDLEEISLFEFDTTLWDIVANGPYRRVAFDWFAWISKNGHWEKLVQVLKRRFPRHHELMSACCEITRAGAPAHTWTIPLIITISIDGAVLR